MIINDELNGGMFDMKKYLKSLLIAGTYCAVLLVGCSSNKEEDKAADNEKTEESVTIIRF